MDKFEPEQQVIKLACSNLHILHRHCLEQILKFDLSKKKQSLCPYCRTPIDEAKMERMTFKGYECEANKVSPKERIEMREIKKELQVFAPEEKKAELSDGNPQDRPSFLPPILRRPVPVEVSHDIVFADVDPPVIAQDEEEI